MARKTTAEATATPIPAPSSKIDQVIALLSREDGTTLAEMVAATGWQAHSTRAALTGLRKKGHAIARTKADGETRYAITAAATE